VRNSPKQGEQEGILLRIVLSLRLYPRVRRVLTVMDFPENN